MHCYICYSKRLEPEMICDICDEHFCEDCSYSFTIHYQFQGYRCYRCADQYRREPLDKRDFKINYILSELE